jgi:hypothetical protein
MAEGITYDQMRELFQQHFGQDSKRGAEEKTLSEQLKELSKATEQTVKRARDSNRGYAEMTRNMLGLNRTAWGAKKSMDDFSKEIDSLDEALKKMEESTENVDSSTRLSLIARRQELAKIQGGIAARDASIKSLANFSKSVGAAAVSTAGSLLKSAQSGGDAFSMAGDVMKLGVNVAGTASQQLGSTLQTVGGSAMALPGKFKAVGVGASIAGAALSGFGTATKALGNFAVDFFVAEAQKVMGAFMTISGSGAVFADGMTGMLNASHQAGLSIKQMSNVIQQNAGTMAASGMGVGQTARMIGRVGEVMKKSNVDAQLLKLGYGFEEQAALSAEVMSDMRRTNSAQLQNPQAIAAATKDYAENLRLIADVTGQDARRKMEEARQASTQVAFRNKLMELEERQPGVTKEILASMAAMDETTKKAVMQQLVLGTVTDKAGSVIMSTSDAYRSGVTDITQQWQSGVFKAADGIQRYGKQMDETRGQLKNFDAIGQAGMAVGAFSEINRALMGIIEKSDSVTEETAKKTRENISKLTTDMSDETTKMVNALVAAQNVTKQLEEMTTARLGAFSEVTTKILNKIEETLKKFDDITTGKNDGGISGLLKDLASGIGEIVATLAGAGLIKKVMAPPKVPTTVEPPGQPKPGQTGQPKPGTPTQPKPAGPAEAPKGGQPPKPATPKPPTPTGPASGAGGSTVTSTLGKMATQAATAAAPAAIMAAPVIAAGITKSEIEKNPFDPRFQGVPYAEQLKREQSGEKGLTIGKVGREQAQKAVVSEGERKTLNELMKRTNEQAKADLEDTSIIRELFKKNDEAYAEAIRILAEKAGQLVEANRESETTTPTTPKPEENRPDIANTMAQSAQGFATAVSDIAETIGVAGTSYTGNNVDWESGFVAAASNTEEKNQAVMTDLLAKNQQAMLATTDQIIREVAGTMQNTTTVISTLNQSSTEVNQEVLKTMREMVVYNQRMLEAMEDTVRYQRRIADNTN